MILRSYKEKTLLQAKHMHAEGIKVITVGITSSINIDEIKAISSPPRILGSDYYLVNNFKSLDNIADDITSRTCSNSNKVPCNGAKLDLVIAAGMFSPSNENWSYIKSWARTIINNYAISISETNVGIVSLRDEVYLDVALNQYTHKADILDAVENAYIS